MATVLIIDDDRHTSVSGHVSVGGSSASSGIPSGRVFVDGDALEAATGWRLKPEGLCRGEVCVPVRDRSALVDAAGVGEWVDVAAVAAALGRPAVVDADRAVVAIGETAHTRAEEMRSLRVPDITLPDLEGRPVNLRAFDRRKVLLLAWSSW